MKIWKTLTRAACELRPMTTAELERVLEIERQSFAEPWGRTCFEYELVEPHARFYGAWPAEAPETLAGFIVQRYILDETHVFNIAVDLAWRGRGIATQLLKRCIAESRERGSTCVTLEVRRSNIAALRLYRRLGFEVWGVRRGYYSDGEDALIMWLSLDASGATSDKGEPPC